MARGFLSGAFWGLVVAGIGTGAASVLTGPVAAPDRGVAASAVAGDEAEAVMQAPAEAADDPAAAEQIAAEPEAIEPDTAEQDTAEPETTEPEATEPETTEPDAADGAQPATTADTSTDAMAAPESAPEPEPENELEAETPGEAEAAPSEEAQAPEARGAQPNVASVEPIDAGSAAAPADAPMIEQVDEADKVALPQTNAAQEAGEDGQAAGPSLGAGASDLSQMAPGIATGRLPSVGGGQEASAPTPLEAFAEPVDVPDGKPLMAIVLVDDGSTPLGLEALEAFPYPLTFAIDTEWAEAADAMARYRAAGFEIMALANLPEGALPSDAQVTLRVALDTVPQGVAVLEGDRGGLQGSRDVSDQVAQILAETGHGLVLYPKGLNTAVSLAQREGVPARSLFRDFDGQGQDAGVIRRFLDQAAFKAGQEGGVIMLGRLRAETISALLIWGLQDRASSVALVPVSKVLTQP